jgi:hypothetical protein
MAKIELYINGINNNEKKVMTGFLSFLHNPSDTESKKRLTEMADKLYGRDIQIGLGWCDGHSAYESVARPRYQKDDCYYNLVKLGEHDVMTDKALNLLGKCLEWDWRLRYSIALRSKDRKLYVISYSNAYSPNWNDVYDTDICIALDDIDFPLLKEGRVIERIENNLHAAINEKLYIGKKPFRVDANGVYMLVKDQHGNYTYVHGKTTDDVFREYADKYTGYRDFRRQGVSEWEIVGEMARENYNEWLKTAKGLKSSFEKFYGGGIVD